MSSDNTPALLEQWHESEAFAEEMVPLVGRLYRERDVVTSIYGRSLVRASATDIVKAHRYARQVTNRELPVAESITVLRAVASLPLDSSRLDLGRLTNGFDPSAQTLDEYLADALATVLSDRGGC